MEFKLELVRSGWEFLLFSLLARYFVVLRVDKRVFVELIFFSGGKLGNLSCNKSKFIRIEAHKSRLGSNE